MAFISFWNENLATFKYSTWQTMILQRGHPVNEASFNFGLFIIETYI
jgi:hypothetical protein